MTHEDVGNLADLKGKTILVATAGRTSWWPWLKAKYGYSDEQTRPTRSTCSRSSPTRTWPSRPIRHRSRSRPSKGVPVKFFLFADDGFPPYGTTIVTTQGKIDKKPDMVARFVRASLEGWKSYMANPGPANALIKTDNPKMTTSRSPSASRSSRSSRRSMAATPRPWASAS